MTLETKLSELIGQHVDQAFIDSIYQRLSSKWNIHAVDPVEIGGTAELLRMQEVTKAGDGVAKLVYR